MRKRRLPIQAIPVLLGAMAVAVAGLAPTASAAELAPSASTAWATCPGSGWKWSSSASGDYHRFRNSLWLYNYNAGSSTQAICGDSGSLWDATVSDPSGNTEALSYPDNQYNFSRPYPVTAVSQSSYAENMNANSGTSAEAAYDIWLNNPGTGTRDEVMIWTQTINRGKVGGASYDAAARFHGVSWQLWNYGPELIWYKPVSSTSGTVYPGQMLQWLQENG